MAIRTHVRSFVLGVAVVGATVIVGAQARPNVKPKDGYVPNAATAVVIGVAVLRPIYGESSVTSHTPYRATLADGVWTVRGTLPPGTVGGTPVAEIAKDDGRVVRVFHEQ
jgi:hypothetical protein